MTLLIRGAKVLTLDLQQPILSDGAVLIEGEQIIAVGSYESLRQRDDIEAELGHETSWICPGFVNAHYHNWRTFSMGAALDAPLELFLLHLSGFEIPEALEAEFTYLNTIASALQLIRSGVTTTLDMTFAIDHTPILQAYLDLGLDLVYAPTTRTQFGYVYADDDTFLATLPAELRDRLAGKGIGLTGGYQSPQDYWQTWQALKARFGDRIQLMLAPDGPEWCSEAELRLWCDRAKQEETGLHLHNSESPMEMQWGLQTRQQSLTEYLAKIGFLGANVSCGHGVWYGDRDIEWLVQSGTTTVHCPSSNLRLSNGIAPVADYLKAGMNVALGTDGQGFADDSDFLEEMRLAALLQRTPGFQTKGLSAWTVFEMATVNGAKAFNRHNMGALKVGNIANVIAIDAKQMSYPYLWQGHDPYTALLQRARSQDVKTVVCKGQVLLNEGQFQTIDEHSIVSRLQSLYNTIWSSQTGERRSLIHELEPYVIQFFEAWNDLPISPRYIYNRQ